MKLAIDIEGALPRVGDHEHLGGAADAVLEDGYDLTFSPGEGIQWELDLHRISGGIEITGRVTGVVALQCYRCLEPFDFPVDIRMREHALMAAETVGPADDYAGEYMVEGGVLDLEPLFRDNIALAFPLKRVCDEACRGICPRCGANLNIENCTCGPEAVDARLKPLEELKRRLENGGEAPA
jgi:uncharacterized protein